jgi:RecJ-like exonuclease
MKKEIKKEKVNATCPHCSKKISLVWICKIESVIGTSYVFFCSECQKSLGSSHEKEFTSRRYSTLMKKKPRTA